MKNCFASKKFRRICSLVMAVICMLTMTTACSSSSDGSSSTSSSGSNSSSNSNSSSTETIKLSFSHHDSATSVFGTFFEEWADLVEEDSGGACEITVYAGATLAAATDGLQALRTGVCDILWTNMAFYSEQFPVMETTVLPLIGNGADAEQFTQVLWGLWEDENVGSDLQEEWSEFKILMLHGSPSYPLGLSAEGYTPSDIAGRTIRTPAGGLTDLMTAINANPILVSSGDIYTSMDKGIIEGYLLDYCGIDGFALEEVTNYALDLNVMNQTMMIVMTQEKFNSLPTAVQEALEANSGYDASMEFAARTQVASDETRAIFNDSGRLLTPSEEDMTLWEEAAEPVWNAYIDKCTSDSFDAQAFFDRMLELVAEYTE